MAIEKKLVCFRTQANFDAQLKAGNIKDYSIVFIKDTQKIWTHGVYFTSLKELFDKLNTKQGKLTASDNITITESGGKIQISAKDTKYTLAVTDNNLILKDSDGTSVATVDLTKFQYTLPQATTDTLGGVKIIDTVGSEGIKTDNITLQTIPSNGKDGQVLVHDGTKGKWLDLGLLDLLTYGVSWDRRDADPHLMRVGNMQLHKTLPIQSNMKGCVYNCLEKRVVYWLDEDNWNFRTSPEVLPQIDLSKDNTTIPTKDTKDLVVGQYIRVLGSTDIATISSITENTSIKVAWQNGANPTGTVTIEIGSRLDGYDGEVMVNVPSFWIRSWGELNRREVRISPTYIDDTWTFQPEVFLGAYRDTVLNTVPENMGYLSTLKVNSAISVANSQPYCRGGNNDPKNDAAEDIFKRQLGKCRIGIDRATFREYTRQAGKEIMSYKQYKNIMYWLWVIEYANFYSQDTYTPELTAEGFRQGGMGDGLTNLNYWPYYNDSNPICPNGYTNVIGNNTGIKLIEPLGPSPVGQVYATRWRGLENIFGDVRHNVDGVMFHIYDSGYNNYSITMYTTDDPALYGDTENEMVKMERADYKWSPRGWVSQWALGTSADIIPEYVDYMNLRPAQYRCAFVTVYPGDYPTLLLGGSAGNSSGLGSLSSSSPYDQKNKVWSFRSITPYR